VGACTGGDVFRSRWPRRGRIELSRDLTAKIDLVFNLKTANVFGLTIAQLRPYSEPTK